ncbi:site-specific integrase [Comamonas sp. CMM03]|uniref:site-specific integrase n=1 Tax=Comamonas sp. CMM03 TaxID=2854781 RepID=UPI001C493E33|nr:site-specific integrase [Comamonas sp. CMM03]MBV7417321.1 site-specific integrase [Comamonas sp. CMM03]
MAYFYRRSSGRYYARIRVPEALLPHFRTQELRRSLNTTDRALACHLALAAALQWKAEFVRLSGGMDLEKLIAGSPLLLSGGLVKLADAAPEMGLSVLELFDQFKARKQGLSVQVGGLMGAAVQQLSYEDGGPGVDVGESLAGKRLSPIFGTLSLRPESLVFTSGEIFTDCVFKDSAGRHVVLDWPGVDVPVGELLATRADCESVRQRLAVAVTPEMRDAARPPAPATDVIQAMQDAATDAALRVSMGEAYKHRDMPCSALLDAYYKAREGRWAPSTNGQNRHMLGLFVELMGDPVLGDIDRELVREYMERVAGVPHGSNRCRGPGKKYHGMDIQGLIKAAGADEVELIGPVRAGRYVQKIGGAFKWAVKNGYMRDDPAAGMVDTLGSSERVKDQDKRQLFDSTMLGRIFNQSWWRSGRSELTAGGKRKTAPYKYWIPLLALYTGARLNELAQLYLGDVRKSEAGTWHLDFNLDGEGKIDADGDKRLKTINAQRVIALHPGLIRLGFLEYVAALRDAGHVRLFPELRHDKEKGYGKYAGQWFNEHFLGKQLGIERGVGLSFHSFRHSFLTACDRIDMPDRMRDDLAGHAPVGSTGHLHYIKSRLADEHIATLSRVGFALPNIAPFDTADGMRALLDAMKRRENLARHKARAKIAAKDS